MDQERTDYGESTVPRPRSPLVTLAIVGAAVMLGHSQFLPALLVAALLSRVD